MRFTEEELAEMEHDIETGWANGLGETAERIVPELRRLYALEAEALPRLDARVRALETELGLALPERT